ncbi:MAG: DUF6350 family protein [Propionibacteriaceae bacterium]|nr:DUF6350 family protein [Propionibacteriaceae bacterium]
MAERSSRHRTIAVDVAEAARSRRPQVTLPWYMLGLLGALSVVASGWLLLAAPAALGWLISPRTELTQAMELASQVLLLAHGAPVSLGGQSLSLVPLGVTLTLVLLGIPVASLSARHAARSQADPDDTGELWVDGQRLVLRVGALYAGAYAATVALVAAVVPNTSIARSVVGAGLIGAIAGLWGAARGIGHDPRRGWPEWTRAIPRALAAALLVCIGVGAAALATALVLERDRVAALADGMGGGPAAGVLLILIQLAWLPNLVLWATAWALGAGVTLGDGSLVSMGISDVGFLPAIPVFGVVPPAGQPESLPWWWLLGGAAAGVVAALIVALARPANRFDETTLVGGLTGVAAGLALVVVCWFGSGGLGSQRLSYLGVRLGDLAITAPSIMGLTGLVTGLVIGIFRREWPEPRPAVRDLSAAPERQQAAARDEAAEETLRR